jgi:hypothetical protein
MINGVKFFYINRYAHLVKVGEPGFREEHVHLLLGLFRQTPVEKFSTEICKIIISKENVQI